MIGSPSLPVVVRCKSSGYESAGWDPTLVAYKAELERLRYRIESMVRKDGGGGPGDDKLDRHRFREPGSRDG